jgi:large subunit ribosomal protein L35
LPSACRSAITPASRRPAKGLPWRRAINQTLRRNNRAIEHHRRTPRHAGKESQMPKIKTKSGAKKRFKVTAGGKVLFAQSGKRHGMIKRTTKQIREHRGTKVMFKTDGDRVRKYWLPNG